MLGFFEAVFMEEHNAKRQLVSRPEGDSLARYGEGLLPLDGTGPYGATSPIFNYPYERTREALVKAAQGREPDPHEATALRYSNPLDGGWAMPTLATWMTHLRAGEATAPMRSTDSMVLHVIEGRVRISVGDTAFDAGPKDTIAVPGWQWRALEASEDAFVFAFSDRVVHEKLGFYREQRRPV
jgi:gentisate 1,2-dioxygenase